MLRLTFVFRSALNDAMGEQVRLPFNTLKGQINSYFLGKANSSLLQATCGVARHTWPEYKLDSSEEVLGFVPLQHLQAHSSRYRPLVSGRPCGKTGHSLQYRLPQLQSSRQKVNHNTLSMQLISRL